MSGTVAAGPVLAGTATRRIDILLRILFDPLVFALVLGGILALFLFSLEIVTLLYTWIQEHQERYRDQLRPTIREEMLVRLVADAPDWETWAEGLSTVEKRVARDVLDTYLRQLQGRERARLEQAGEALGIPDQSVTMIREGDRHQRLRALVWLSLLEYPVDPDMLWNHCRDDPTVRAAAARVLYTTESDDAAAIGTRLLLAETSRQMTSFGMDTLYRLHRDEPDTLFEYASEEVDGWSEAVTVQVLAVVRKFTTLSEDTPTAWLLSLATHDSPAIRAATARAFAGFGWNDDLREQIPLDTLGQDPSPDVRRAVCEMLASWNDDEARARLRSIACTDTDARVRLVAMQGLPDDVARETIQTGDTDPVPAWVAAERAIRGRRV